MRILVVDDNEDSRKVLTKTLESEGYTVGVAINGEDAFKMAKESPPNMIISDILMPVMDGFQLCREVKGDDRLKRVPFVFYTATYTDKKDEALAMQMGADKFIRKPVEPDEFQNIVKGLATGMEKGEIGLKKPVLIKEDEVFKLYNERLVKKLEKKMLELKKEINERKEAEEALLESERQLRALTVRLGEVEEAERKRLAQELHDLVGQNLTALNINLNIVKANLPLASKGDATTRLADSLTLVEETTEHIRDVMAELRPQVLDDYGLMAALRWYGERFSERTGTPVEVGGEDLFPRLPHCAETAFFRIAQEATTNVAKHAQANRATMSLEEVDRLVRLTITDDGVGFDSADLREGKRPGWGLITMKERAQAFDGQVLIDSEPGKGTRVVVEVKR